MNNDKRRQHVTKAVSNLGESGTHIPVTDSSAVEPQLQSFAYIAPKEASDLGEEEAEFVVPKGTPSLFEATADSVPDERLEYPSPLSPHEIEHAIMGESPDLAQPKTLEEKFATAINIPEVPTDSSSENLVINTELPTNPAGEQVLAPNETPQTEAVQATLSTPHHDHFTGEAAPLVLEEQGVEDTGLGAFIMSKRQTEKEKLEQEAG